MSDTTPGTPKQSWWRRLSSGLKRTSSALGTAVADLVIRRKLDRAMLDDIEDVLLRADLGTAVAVRIALSLIHISEPTRLGMISSADNWGTSSNCRTFGQVFRLEAGTANTPPP